MFLKKMNWKQLLLFFPFLFLIDDILGFNGYQFTIGGKSIRIILFCLSVFSLCFYSLIVVKQENMTLFRKKEGVPFLFQFFKPFDYAVFSLILFSAVWASIVPLIVRGEMHFSLKEFSTVLVLVLYFPLVFLIRTGRLQYKKIEKAVYGLAAVLAFWHILMYIGETVSPGFYPAYYDFIDWISFGTAVRSPVVYGFGITRIVQVTSTFLLYGAFLSVRYVLEKKYAHLFASFLFLFALCVTYTKSFWIGFGVGICFCLALGTIFAADKKTRFLCLGTFAALVLMVVALNYTVFEGSIFNRLWNSVNDDSTAESLKQNHDNLYSKLEEDENATEPSLNETEKNEIIAEIQKIENQIKDYNGTAEANALRGQQTQALLSKWRQNKWFGFGYGAYVEDFIRGSSEAPFMYESFLPALLMKLGVIGFLPWLVLIVFAFVSAFKNYWNKKKDLFFWWIGFSLSFAMAVQTNPFMFTFAGFSYLLLILFTAAGFSSDDKTPCFSE